MSSPMLRNGALLVIAAGAAFLLYKLTSSTKRKKKGGQMSTEEVINALEERYQRDEGNRGIKPLISAVGPGELYRAVKCALQPEVEHVVIITGLPCLLDFDPPTETDGPLGAMAMALAFIRLGKRVTVMTDEANEAVVLAAGAALGATTTPPLINSEEKPRSPRASPGPHTILSNLTLESLPPANKCDDNDIERLSAIAESAQLVIAIERAGKSIDGTYRTMRNLDMTKHVAPIDMLFDKTGLGAHIESIGIGDGGNECGMGKIFDDVIKSNIPNAPKIACQVAADHCLVGSISNWAGYALAAAMAVYAADNNLVPPHLCPNPAVDRDEVDGDDYLTTKMNKMNKGAVDCTAGGNISRKALVASCLITAEDEKNILSRTVDAGGRDGITRKQELTVDSLSLAQNTLVLEDMRKLAMGE